VLIGFLIVGKEFYIVMNTMNKKIVNLSSILFETVAGQLAATFYEVGRGQGMTSVHKNARAYARANIEKFLPKAIEYCIDMLARPDISQEMKEIIFDALQERVNDPTNVTSTDIKGLPAMDIKKLLANLPQALPNQQLKKVREKPINVLTSSTAIGKVRG